MKWIFILLAFLFFSCGLEVRQHVKYQNNKFEVYTYIWDVDSWATEYYNIIYCTENELEQVMTNEKHKAKRILNILEGRSP